MDSTGRSGLKVGQVLAAVLCKEAGVLCKKTGAVLAKILAYEGQKYRQIPSLTQKLSKTSKLKTKFASSNTLRLKSST